MRNNLITPLKYCIEMSFDINKTMNIVREIVGESVEVATTDLQQILIDANIMQYSYSNPPEWAKVATKFNS